MVEAWAVAVVVGGVAVVFDFVVADDRVQANFFAGVCGSVHVFADGGAADGGGVWFVSMAAGDGGIVAGAVALAMVLCVFTFGQTEYWHDSVTLFVRAKGITAPNEMVAISLGCAYRIDGRLEDAERELKKVIELVPDSAEGHHWLINVYLDMEKPEEALSEAKIFMKLSTDQEAGNKLYGIALLATGRYDEAVAALEKASKLNEGDEETRRALAAARQRAGMP